MEEKGIEKVTCDCGSIVLKKNMSSHVKTKKHQACVGGPSLHRSTRQERDQVSFADAQHTDRADVSDDEEDDDMDDGEELEDEGMDNDNWRGQWASFSVHHNKK